MTRPSAISILPSNWRLNQSAVHDAIRRHPSKRFHTHGHGHGSSLPLSPTDQLTAVCMSHENPPNIDNTHSISTSKLHTEVAVALLYRFRSPSKTPFWSTPKFPRSQGTLLFSRVRPSVFRAVQPPYAPPSVYHVRAYVFSRQKYIGLDVII